jgi:hypothetical protein
MTQAKSRPLGKRVLGVALMLLGAAMIGWGAHYLTINGTCSSTGYVSYGPVPKCSGGEFFYITATFFAGPAVALVGWGYAQIFSLLWPLVCLATGAGMITIRLDQNAATGSAAFGLAAGIVFFALAVVSGVVTVRNRRRGKTRGAVVPGVGAVSAGSPGGPLITPGSSSFTGPAQGHLNTPAPGPVDFGGLTDDSPSAGAAGMDPLDRIAKLAQLRDSGALTNEEFEREKAKLLSQM